MIFEIEGSNVDKYAHRYTLRFIDFDNSSVTFMVEEFELLPESRKSDPKTVVDCIKISKKDLKRIAKAL